CPAPAVTCSSPLSLHDALPILVELLRLGRLHDRLAVRDEAFRYAEEHARILRLLGGRIAILAVAIPIVDADADDLARVRHRRQQDRKSTRLNSSHVKISYAVLC